MMRDMAPYLTTCRHVAPLRAFGHEAAGLCGQRDCC